MQQLLLLLDVTCGCSALFPSNLLATGMRLWTCLAGCFPDNLCVANRTAGFLQDVVTGNETHWWHFVFLAVKLFNLRSLVKELAKRWLKPKRRMKRDELGLKMDESQIFLLVPDWKVEGFNKFLLIFRWVLGTWIALKFLLFTHPVKTNQPVDRPPDLDLADLQGAIVAASKKQRPFEVP